MQFFLWTGLVCLNKCSKFQSKVVPFVKCIKKEPWKQIKFYCLWWEAFVVSWHIKLHCQYSCLWIRYTNFQFQDASSDGHKKLHCTEQIQNSFQIFRFLMLSKIIEAYFFVSNGALQEQETKSDQHDVLLCTYPSRSSAFCILWCAFTSYTTFFAASLLHIYVHFVALVKNLGLIRNA